MPAGVVPELYVTDLDVSLAFYAALGFEIVYRREEERFARIASGDAELMLEEPLGRTWLLAALHNPRGVGISLTITTNATDTLFASLPPDAIVLLAPETRHYARAHDTIAVRQFVVADPDGYLLRFTETLDFIPARPPATP